MKRLNRAKIIRVSGASGAYDPAWAGASARHSQHTGSQSGSAGNGNHDIYAGTESCVLSIGFGALGGLRGGPLGAIAGVLSNGYGSCIGSANNGSGDHASQSGTGNCLGGTGGVCN